MAIPNFLIASVLLFAATCFAEDTSLEALWNSTNKDVHHAREHINHMLTLTLTPEAQQKVGDSVKNACDHFSTELETHGNELQTKSQGSHKSELTTAATNAASHFKTWSETLKGLSGSDISQKNTEYFKAADLVLDETKKLIEVGPCDEIAPIIRNALNELKNDCNSYQNQFHTAVGPHEPPAGAKGGHDHHHHHGEGHVHPHQHSDESRSSSEEHKH